MKQVFQKQDWLEQCAAHFREVGLVDQASALQIAKSCWDSTVYFLGSEVEALAESPAGVAGEEMSYWDAD